MSTAQQERLLWDSWAYTDGILSSSPVVRRMCRSGAAIRAARRHGETKRSTIGRASRHSVHHASLRGAGTFGEGTRSQQDRHLRRKRGDDDGDVQLPSGSESVTRASRGWRLREGAAAVESRFFTITITEEDKINFLSFRRKNAIKQKCLLLPARFHARFFFDTPRARTASGTVAVARSTRACSPLRAVGAWARRSADCPSSIRRFESACGGVGIAIISNEKRMELLMTSTTRFVDGTARAFAVGLGGLHGREL